jgi:hypothetical protein
MSTVTLHEVLVVATLLLALGSMIGYSYQAKRWIRVLAAGLCVAGCIAWEVSFKLASLYPLIAGLSAMYVILLLSWIKKH